MKKFIIIEVLVVLLTLLFLAKSANFQAKSDVRMLFWQAKGSPNIPDELRTEERARQLLKSRVVWKRVSEKLSWEISHRDYERMVELESRRHAWELEREILMNVLARGSTAEKAIELCNLTSLEFSGRCQELALEFDKLFWEVEMAKVQGPLEQWKYENQADNALELEDRSALMRQRLKLSIAAAQMELRDAKKAGGAGGRPSVETVELVENLQELDKALDDFWLKGVNNESVSDLEDARRVYQEQLKKSIQSDQMAALVALQDALHKLKQRHRENSEPALLKATEELRRLKNAFKVLKEARDLSLGEMTMYCHPFRKAEKAKELASTLRQLAPVVMLLLLLMVTALLHCQAAAASPD